MATLDQLRTVVAAKIGMVNSGTDQDFLDAWANEGVTDILIKTGCKVCSATMSLDAGEVDYTLSTDIMLIIHLLDSGGQELDRVSFSEMIEMRRAGSSSTPARSFTTAGSSTLLIHPTPTSAEVLTVYYVPRPVVLTADSDRPGQIPAEFHKAIEWYMLWQAGDYVDDGTSQMGERYRALYDRELLSLRRYISLKGGTRLAPIRRRRRSVPHDNSTYLR